MNRPTFVFHILTLAKTFERALADEEIDDLTEIEWWHEFKSFVEQKIVVLEEDEE